MHHKLAWLSVSRQWCEPNLSPPLPYRLIRVYRPTSQGMSELTWTFHPPLMGPGWALRKSIVYRHRRHGSDTGIESLDLRVSDLHQRLAKNNLKAFKVSEVIHMPDTKYVIWRKFRGQGYRILLTGGYDSHKRRAYDQAH